jgi:hypothetical protein
MLVEVVLSSAGFGEVATLPFGHWVPRSLLSPTWTFAKFEVTGRHDQFARQLPLPFCTGFLRTIQQMFPSSRVVTVESSHCSDEAVPMSKVTSLRRLKSAFRRSNRRSKDFASLGWGLVSGFHEWGITATQGRGYAAILSAARRNAPFQNLSSGWFGNQGDMSAANS